MDQLFLLSRCPLLRTSVTDSGLCFDTYLQMKLSTEANKLILDTYLCPHTQVHISHILRRKFETAGGCHRFLQVRGFVVSSWSGDVLPSYFDFFKHKVTSNFNFRSYAQVKDIGKPGPLLLRPFHLVHRADFGLRGTGDHVPRPILGGSISRKHKLIIVQQHGCVFKLGMLI